MTPEPAARRRHRPPVAAGADAGYGSTRAGARAAIGTHRGRLRPLGAAKKPPAQNGRRPRQHRYNLAGTDGVIHSACGHQR